MCRPITRQDRGGRLSGVCGPDRRRPAWRVCSGCGVGFLPLWPGQNHCSGACQAGPQPRRCRACGGELPPGTNWNGVPRVYCCGPCGYAWRCRVYYRRRLTRRNDNA